MIDEARKMIDALRNSYGYSERRDKEAAELIETLLLVIEQKDRELAGFDFLLTSAQSAAETYKRERDAAIADMEKLQGCICQACKHYYQPDQNVRKWSCRVFGNDFGEISEDGVLACGKFKWRGVKNDA